MNSKNTKAYGIVFSHAELLSKSEALEGKKVEFLTAHHFYVGKLKNIVASKFSKHTLCIEFNCIQWRRKTVRDPWKAYYADYIKTSLGDRVIISEINGGNSIYIAFPDANNMTIYKNRSI